MLYVDIPQWYHRFVGIIPHRPAPKTRGGLLGGLFRDRPWCRTDPKTKTKRWGDKVTEVEAEDRQLL